MTTRELIEMVDALEIPPKLTTDSQYAFTSLEVFCLLCACFHSGGDMYSLSMLYDRTQSLISEVVNDLIIYLDEVWEHLLDCDQDHLLRPSELARYANAIHQRGAPIKTVFGFIDCTIWRIAHPTWFQRQAYNGHKKFHALEFQALMLPNGIIGHLYGPSEGCRNNNLLLMESGLLECLAHFAHPEDLADAPYEERTYQMFRDPAYGVGPHIISPFAGMGDRTEEEKAWNAEMSAVRIEVEHGFGIVANTWPFLNAGWKMQLYSSPVGRYYWVGVLLTNCINCLWPNQVSQYFDCHPPKLNEYLHH